MISGAEKLTGKNTCLGSGLGSVEHLVVAGYRLHSLIFQLKAPRVSETGLGWKLRRWCFYSSCQGCVYTLGYGLSV